MFFDFECFFTGMGEIGKQRQLNKKKQNRVVQDFSFYKMRWTLKFSLKHNFN